jgi:arabinosaccharide transport system substrate-binding protein
MLARTDVPDVVEINDGSMGFFTRGPLSDVGFLDLTERVAREGYRPRIVESRFSKWQSRGRVFAVPHDVHPVMLMYRADLVEALGINVDELDTWDAFAKVGQKVRADLDGDGVSDRYMIDLPLGGGFGFQIMMLQRGLWLFGPGGEIVFNDPRTVETMIWYLRHTHGPQRIAVECGWGQSLMKAMTDGLALFYMAPDWRTFTTQLDLPNLKGKWKVMPLPAWEKGGRRTSVWGGTGLAISRMSKRPDLAWELAKFLYFTPSELGRRYAETLILPPFKDAWNLPEFQAPNAYFSGQKLGAEYAKLAPDTPPSWDSPYSRTGENKMSEVFLRAIAHYKQHGEQGLREAIERELSVAAAYLQRLKDRNVLQKAH